MKDLKGVIQIVALIVVILFISFLMLQLDKRGRLSPQVESSEYLVPTKVYRPPIIRIPFVRYKTPIPFDALPIPPEDIDRTITITTIGETPVEATLVVDRRGNVYKTINFPEGVNVEVVEWEPPVFQVAPRFGYSLVYSGELYHCLSVDLIRLWRLQIGCEIGIQLAKISVSDALVGASLKYRFGTIELFGAEGDIRALLGWNFINQKPYLGVSIGW